MCCNVYVHVTDLCLESVAVPSAQWLAAVFVFDVFCQYLKDPFGGVYRRPVVCVYELGSQDQTILDCWLQAFDCCTPWNFLKIRGRHFTYLFMISLPKYWQRSNEPLRHQVHRYLSMFVRMDWLARFVSPALASACFGNIACVGCRFSRLVGSKVIGLNTQQSNLGVLVAT